MRVVVPFAVESPKTRLSPVLADRERRSFARAMLADVLRAIVAAGYEPTVLATAPIDLEADFDLTVSDEVREATTIEVDDRSLTEAVNARLPAGEAGKDDGTTDDAVGVVMADLALTTADALERLFSGDADVAIAPGRGGGTNALAVRHPEFRVDYHGASYLDHREIAADSGLTVETVDSFRLATDIDEPDDLVEVLIHGTEHAPTRLRSFGFELEERDGRVTVARSAD
ncbi:2-phospho-L-lactate guanylyltransferase [Halopiger aswanensis]|uniref:2-phospho-L-lactate guanylyltransferase n=1 Tax=Halopiger aswanensis TaxID=148449 RepID=A0A3R7EBZ2_9EURY|nr:2-phospho-L-lactate guanylyltransferase [Halopiger aswanensis]RKD88124.1 phospholactate guanylyltransferase [Halopiger aswanensis]